MKITGIKKVCTASKVLAPEGYAPRLMLQVNVNTKTGAVDYDVLPANSGYIVHNDPDIYFVCNIFHPATMDEIRNTVQARLDGYYTNRIVKDM